jgi:phosphoribosyl 1,2-cyclic phosphodiesterase
MTKASTAARKPRHAAQAAPAGSAWLKFWGVRGSIPTPGPTTVQSGGNTSCIEIRADGEIIILDAGTGIRLLGSQLLAELGTSPLELTLLLTHTHWDHIQGLPFFQPFYQRCNRLRILGYEGARQGLAVVLSGLMGSQFFPIALREVPANVQIEELKEMEFNVGPVRVQACRANHPGKCFGYRLFTSAGSIAFFPDNELQPQDEGATRKMTDFLRGTDVLAMDTQFDAHEYQQHKGWGHGCLDDVVALAHAAAVKRLFLFHHDPDHDDAKISQMEARARELVKAWKSPLQVEAAREGVRVDLAA